MPNEANFEQSGTLGAEFGRNGTGKLISEVKQQQLNAFVLDCI